MTAFGFFKLICAAIAMITGAIWIRRRIVPVTAEGSDNALMYVKGWDAVMSGVAAFALGVALLLDALGVVVWIGEW